MLNSFFSPLGCFSLPAMRCYGTEWGIGFLPATHTLASSRVHTPLGCCSLHLFKKDFPWSCTSFYCFQPSAVFSSQLILVCFIYRKSYFNSYFKVILLKSYFLVWLFKVILLSHTLIPLIKRSNTLITAIALPGWGEKKSTSCCLVLWRTQNNLVCLSFPSLLVPCHVRVWKQFQ